ncbi:MAG: DUF4239 domain-containing protein [Actinobacteria bacterium]|nr:DUF4239 domain-containing protein [Actinomycetota bacterium]
MNFTRYMLDYSPAVRGLIATIAMIGISLVMVTIFHSRVVNLDFERVIPEPSEDGEQTADDAEPALEWKPRTEFGRKGAESVFLAGMVRGLVATAFVFLFAFTMSNMWSSASDARDAVQYESSALVKAYFAAQAIPDDQGGTELRAAVRDYWTSAENEQWPLMRAADKDQALTLLSEQSMALAKAALAAQKAGADKAPTWGSMNSAISDMTDNGSTRILRVPSSTIPGVLAVIMVLGITNLVVTAIFQPARLRPTLVLIGLMATITAFLFFIVVEVSNPYLGGSAIEPPPINSEMMR